jgi:mannose-1-phosphate guanylyltransferase/MurNAc alpha-1-phosphate uridylyltransferase
VAGSRHGGICGLVLSAGEGQRLRPLTEHLPKALCPVGNVALLDRALARLAGLGLSGTDDVAVNAAYLAGQVVEHVGGRVHVSVEHDGPLGTSGGVARLRSWIDGRGVLVGNADGYLADPARDPGKDIAAMVDGWSGETVRMLTKPCRPGEGGGFSGRRFAGFSLIPWRYVRDIPEGDGSLVRWVWRPAEADGALELIPYEGVYIDTGTPADYLRANLHAAYGQNLIHPTARINAPVHESVIGPHARIDGPVTRCVVWAGAQTTADEDLTDVIRAPGLTVPA